MDNALTMMASRLSLWTNLRRFVACLTLFITVYMAYSTVTYSRDQLMALRGYKVQLDIDRRSLVSRLCLRRRGCRAGAHHQRRVQAARSVTSSTSCTLTAGEIPTITGHRVACVNKQQQQLFHRRREVGRVRLLIPVAEFSSTDEHGGAVTSQPKLLLPTGHLDECTWSAELPPLLFAAQSSDRPLPSPVNDLSTNNDSTTRTDQSVSSLSPAVSVSLNTEPSFVSDFSFDLSNYCLSTLYRSSDPLDVSDTQSHSSLALSTAPKTSRFRIPSIFNANLRGGFCHKIDELSVILHQNQVDLACLTETWLNRSIDDSLTQIPGYLTYRLDRNDGRQGGGVVILAKQDLSCKVIDLPNPTSQEVLWLLYRHPCMPRLLTHILIGCAYFPPALILGS